MATYYYKSQKSCKARQIKAMKWSPSALLGVFIG